MYLHTARRKRKGLVGTVLVESTRLIFGELESLKANKKSNFFVTVRAFNSKLIAVLVAHSQRNATTPNDWKAETDDHSEWQYFVFDNYYLLL